MEQETSTREIPRLYSPIETGERFLKCSKWTVIRLIQKGYLKAIKLPGRNRFGIYEEDILNYLRNAEPYIPKNSVQNQKDLSTQEG